MKITKIKYYGGAREKVCRLGLSHLFLELQELLIDTEIKILKKKQANGAGVLRERIDNGFDSVGGWIKKSSGGIDWTKKIRYNESIVSRIGVEVQVSGRSDLLAKDILHIRNDLQKSIIDVGVIVVASKEFEYYLTDRVANIDYAIEYVETHIQEAQTYPIIILAVEHDAFSDTALPKKRTNVGKKKKP